MRVDARGVGLRETSSVIMAHEKDARAFVEVQSSHTIGVDGRD